MADHCSSALVDSLSYLASELEAAEESTVEGIAKLLAVLVESLSMHEARWAFKSEISRGNLSCKEAKGYCSNIEKCLERISENLKNPLEEYCKSRLEPNGWTRIQIMVFPDLFLQLRKPLRESNPEIIAAADQMCQDIESVFESHASIDLERPWQPLKEI